MRTFSDDSLAESKVEEKRPEFALVLNGHSLVYALKPDLELLLLGKNTWEMGSEVHVAYFGEPVSRSRQESNMMFKSLERFAISQFIQKFLCFFLVF